MPLHDENVGLAFGLTIAAGAATALGASVVFVPRFVQLATARTLAASLALSAGVMTYVSFVEISVKSLSKFKAAGNPDNIAYMYATACFFGGVVIMLLLHVAIDALVGAHHHQKHDHHRKKLTVDTESEKEQREGEDANTEEMNIDSVELMPWGCTGWDPNGDLELLQLMGKEMERKAAKPKPQEPQECSPYLNEEENGDGEQKRDVENLCDEREDQQDEKVKKQELLRMSLNTAIAIALHNFPEGLATFLSTLADPAVGFVLCVAISIHNIPEGLCVAMPVYYATGSRWKAFGWAVLSGLSEPLAALLGWAVLAGAFSDTLYAVMFGLVAGMMVIISARELLPTAHKYDPEDEVVTYFFILGMAIMALSLLLFMI